MKTVIRSALFVMSVFSALAAQEATMQGKVTNELTGRPVPFAVIALPEQRIKTRANEDGLYSIKVPPGNGLTFIVTASGLQPLQIKLNVAKSGTMRNFVLSPLKVTASAITIKGDRDVQKVSRYTMTVEDLKEVPGSFGDSLNALASLPGIIRSGGFLGELVIRGFYPDLNRYYLDDMPLYNPQHFGGLHSVINNDMMSEIDVFSSAYGADVAGGSGPVIRINTIDEVKEFSGNSEVNVLSANAFVKTPITEGFPHQGLVSPGEDKQKDKSIGYYGFGGRVSYYQVLVPTFVLLLTGEEAREVPQYYDYQGKVRYYLNHENSLSLILAGSFDGAIFIRDETTTDKLERAENGADPLTFDITATYDVAFNNAGLEYRYKPSESLHNRITAFAVLAQTYQAVDLPSSSFMNNIYIRSRPDTYGIKNTLDISAFDKAVLWRSGAEAQYNHFVYDSRNPIPTNPLGGGFDLNDETSFIVLESKKEADNFQAGAFTFLRLKKWGVLLEPGVRSDYLQRTSEVTVDPRAKAAIEFPTDTTVSFAYGTYSMFLQTNPFYFRGDPEAASYGSFVKPYVATHRVAGLEQKRGLYFIKLEGFYNTVENMFTQAVHCTDGSIPNSDLTCNTGEFRPGYSIGQMQMYGAEVLLRRDKRIGSSDVFGWISYTWSRSLIKNGVEGDPQNEWSNSLYDQPHNIKVVIGQTRGEHTISAKFQAYSGFPYNPIIGSTLDADYEAIKASNFPSRYVPEYAATRSARYDIDHSLDLRYAYRKKHSWGELIWYIEVINAYRFMLDLTDSAPANSQDWMFNKPYQPGVNPVMEGSPTAFTIPNFGVEVKF